MLDGGVIIAPQAQSQHATVQVILDPNTVIIIPNVPSVNVDHSIDNTFHFSHGTSVNLGCIDRWDINRVKTNDDYVFHQRVHAGKKTPSYFSHTHRSNLHSISLDDDQ